MEEFIQAIKEIEPTAFQRWVDESGWYLPGECKYPLQIWLRDGLAYVSPQGYGSTQQLIAKTPEELKDCVNIWWRNREN